VPAPTSWWEDLYRSSNVADLPWYTPLLDSDFELALKMRLPEGGKVLDLGTGPATQAIALAKRGYEVVASDVAPSAIEKAKHMAAREAVRIDFRVDNILDSKLEDGLVDAIVDRGVFHVMPPESRPRYVAAVQRILRPRGYLLLKAFSDKEPRQEGPYHISPAELRARFERDFEVLSIGDASFQGLLPHPPKSLFAVLRRR
jgi:cyclopropane fatty-acyl-phospholipid synthase-like methyltransferase